MKEKFKKIDELGLSSSTVLCIALYNEQKREKVQKSMGEQNFAAFEEKLKKFYEILAIEGLDEEEVLDYLFQKDAENQKKAIEEMISKKRAESQKLAMCMPADDVRSKALLFDYAFEGGKFASTPDAYPNCLGIVGWINPDPNASEGNRLYVLLFKPRYFSYVDGYCLTKVDYFSDDCSTMKYIDYSKSFIFEHSLDIRCNERVKEQRRKMMEEALNRIRPNVECLSELISQSYMKMTFFHDCNSYHGVALENGIIRCFLNY